MVWGLAEGNSSWGLNEGVNKHGLLTFNQGFVYFSVKCFPTGDVLNEKWSQRKRIVFRCLFVTWKIIF